MVDTDEPTEALDLARRSLDDLDGLVGSIGFWERIPNGPSWSIRFELTPDGLDPAGPIATATSWYAVVEDTYPDGTIEIRPAKDGGIVETFAHQAPNRPGGDDVPWRAGTICIVDTVHGHELSAKREEPAGAYQRLSWHVGRTIGWLERASHGRLLSDGEPFEMPVFGQAHGGTTIAFAEGPETFAAWRASSRTYGIADLAPVTDDRDRPTLAVVAWRDLARHEILRPEWGSRIAAARVTEMALWFRFERLMVRPPWRAPQTLSELRDFAREQGQDFDVLLRRGTSAIQDGKAHYVLLGFPVPQVMGEEASRFLWVGFRLAPVSKAKRAKTQVKGFRPHTAAWMTDRRTGAVADDVPLDWIGSEDWHPAELAARGRFEGGLAGRSVALIGAGAFGSDLGRLLVRGGVHDLAVFDAGYLEAGNLARHELSLLEIGRHKAVTLAERLNTLSPSARVVGFASNFPPTDDDAKAALARAEIVVDASASESVAEALARYDWGDECRFASVSFSFGAEKLYLYLADGVRISSQDFARQIAPWLKADERPAEDFPHEGTGCWSSVFPARADDVSLLAAIAVRQIDSRLSDPIPEPRLIVYARNDDGTVSIADDPR